MGKTKDDPNKVVKDYSKEWTPQRVAEEKARLEKEAQDARRAEEEFVKQRDAKLAKYEANMQNEIREFGLVKDPTGVHTFVRAPKGDPTKSRVSPEIIRRHNEYADKMNSLPFEQAFQKQEMLLRVVLKKVKNIEENQESLEVKMERVQRSIENIDIDEIDRLEMTKLHNDFAELTHNAEQYVKHKKRCRVNRERQR